MRNRFFNWLGYVTYRRYWLVLLVCLAVTVVFGYFAGKIRMEATWLSMFEKAKNLPKNKLLFTDYNPVPFLIHVSDSDNHT